MLLWCGYRREQYCTDTVLAGKLRCWTSPTLMFEPWPFGSRLFRPALVGKLTRRGKSAQSWRSKSFCTATGGRPGVHGPMFATNQLQFEQPHAAKLLFSNQTSLRGILPWEFSTPGS